MAIIKKKIENLKPGKEYVLTVRAKNSDLNVLSDYSDSIRFQVPNDTTTPSILTNLQLFAGLENVMFVFDYSQDLDVRRYEYELYQNSNMSDEGGPLTGFADANVFTVRVSNLQLEEDGSGLAPFWGRARTIDTTGNVGPWTSLVQTDPHTPLIDNQYIGSLTASKITAGTIGAHEIILTQSGTATTIESPDNKAILRSSDYNGEYNNLTNTWSAGSTGWIISGDGRAEFNNATIRGTLQFIDGSAPGSIFYGATQPSIPSPFTAKLISAISGNGTSVTYTTETAHGLSVGKIVSLNHVIPSQYNLKNQYVTAVTTSAPYTFTVTSSATGTFDPIYSIGAEVVAGQIPEFSIWYNSTSGDNKSYIYSSSAWNQSLANVSNLNPQNQTQTGLIAGTTITGGGITLTTGGNIKGGQTAYDTGTGFFLGYSGTTHKFSIGNSAGNKLTWDGETLTIKGTLQFFDGVTPGRFTNGDALTGGSIAGLTIGSTKMYIGTGTFNNANTAFYVDNAGQLSLKDKLSWNGTTLTVTGSITGSTITGSTLKTAATGDRVEINSNDIYLYNTATSTTSIKFDGTSVPAAFGVIQSLNAGIQIKGSGSTTYTVGAAAVSEYQWDGSTGRMLTLSRVTGSTVLTVAGSIDTTAVTATGNLNGSQVQLSGASAGYYQYDRSNQAVNWTTYVNGGFYRIYNSVFGDRLALSSNDLYIYTLQVNAGGTALRYIAGGQVTAAASKRSLKNDINYNISGLSIINKLKPASFTWKKTEMESEEVGKIKALHKNYGFIAEDIAEADGAIAVLEPVINESMTQEEKVNSYKDIDSWIPSYYSETGILALAVKSIQELSERLEILENK
jgi:hypothetical protein